MAHLVNSSAQLTFGHSGANKKSKSKTPNFLCDISANTE